MSTGDLMRALRGQMTTRLGDHAEVLPLRFTWDDLELAEEQARQFDEVRAAWRHRGTVLDDWGFAIERKRGLGLTVLLYGPPGTGKTMAASVLAAELDLQLFRVDLSRVVDKYIGETEKALAKVFDEAERGEVLLLFDEADSLFGQRTSVSSSTDRYANLEVNYLLQRIESYRGITVLNTNHEQLMDEAFKRGLSHRVHFPMPDAPQRAQIWRRLIPPEAPLSDDVDTEELGERFEMSGGHIKNAVLTAAVRAAMGSGQLEMRHFIEGGNREYGTLGKVVREWS